MQEATLCLTGTVNVHADHTVRTSPAERLADYKGAIRFYLDHTDLPVIFAENSDYDFAGDPDFEIFSASDRFTLFRSPHHPDTTKGKGFQEFHMLDRVVNEALQTPLMVKVTGRYIVRNIASLLPGLTAPLNIDIHRKMQVALSGFFAVESAVYRRYFEGCYADADDAAGRYIEHVLYRVIADTPLRKMTALLPENPIFEGVSGSYGGSLQRNKYKMMLRSAERSLNRSLGISRFLIEY